MKGVLSYIWCVLELCVHCCLRPCAPSRDRALMFGRRAKRAVGIGSQSINKPFGAHRAFFWS